MQFDFKFTIWSRVEVSKDLEQKVLNAILNGTITHANQIWEIDPDASCITLNETEKPMTIENNQGEATIEVLTTAGTTIYTNKKQM